MIYEQKFFIGMGDVGPGQLLTDKAVLEMMSDTANAHGKSIGQYSGIRDEIHMAWVVLNWRLQVLMRLRVCETAVCRTWSRGYNRAFATRDYSLLDEQGTLCARATSSWMLVDLNRRFPMRLTPELMDSYQSEPDRATFPDYAFPRYSRLPVEPEKRVTLPLMKCLFDCNGHVHNTAYMDLALEILPEEAVLCDEAEITYVHEMKPDERAVVGYARHEGKHVVTVQSAADGLLHAVISVW